MYKSTLVEVLRRIVSRSVRQEIVFFPWMQSLLVLQIVQIYIWSLSMFYFYLSREDSHLFQVVSDSKFVSVGVQSPTEINAPRGCAVIL